MFYFKCFCNFNIKLFEIALLIIENNNTCYKVVDFTPHPLFYDTRRPCYMHKTVFKSKTSLNQKPFKFSKKKRFTKIKYTKFVNFGRIHLPLPF